MASPLVADWIAAGVDVVPGPKYFCKLGKKFCKDAVKGGVDAASKAFNKANDLNKTKKSYSKASGSRLGAPGNSVTPNNLKEQLTLQEASSHPGRIIATGSEIHNLDRLKKQYGDGIWEKVHYSNSAFAKDRSEIFVVHFYRERLSGKIVEMKFK